MVQVMGTQATVAAIAAAAHMKMAAWLAQTPVQRRQQLVQLLRMLLLLLQRQWRRQTVPPSSSNSCSRQHVPAAVAAVAVSHELAVAVS